MDAVDEVKSRLSIEDVIGEYVELKRAGRNFKALSPFGNEKSPSFMVSPDKQIWHDFSSGKGGNMFSFVMEMEGLDFKEALELLARKAGVDLGEYRRGGKDLTQQKERLHAANEAAAHFYQVQFSKNQTALEYVFKKRQFTKDTALTWRLGYSPNTGTALISFLKGKGFTLAELKRAGLTNQYGKDMFRGRLMIPLQDQQGQVIGFTARLLVDDPNAPKYINTPATLLYDKSRHVYGLHLAKEAIRKSDFAVLAEGNLDVIASHQAGVKQVVATAGTALTEMQFKTIGRFTRDVRLAFDQDTAGQNAAERAIPIAAKVDVSLSMITVSQGKDPDELVRKDPKLWQAAVTQKQYALDWLIARYQAQLDLASATGKREFSDVLLRVVRQLPDAVEQDHYLTQIAEVIGVSREALEAKLRGIDKPASPKKRHVQPPSSSTGATKNEQVKTSNHLLALLLMHPKLRPYANHITDEMLVGDEARQLFEYLSKHPDFSGKPQEVAELRELADYVKMTTLLYEETYQGIELLELQYEVHRLRSRLIEQFVKTKKSALVHAMRESPAKENEYLTQVRELDALLKLSREGGAHA